MRLNIGTLLLLAVAVGVIVLSVYITNQPEATTPTSEAATAEGGPLFIDLTADAVQGLTVYTNDGFYTQLTRSADDAAIWALDGPEDAADRVIDQTKAGQVIVDLADLTFERRFDVDSLAEFGLDAPLAIIVVDRAADMLDVAFVGSRNPSNNRYYVITRQVNAADWSATGAVPDMADGATVYLVPTATLDKVKNIVSAPPYQPLPTATPTATATLNPMSEVEMATATAVFEATATAQMEAVLATIDAQTPVAETTAEPVPDATVQPGND